MLQGFDSIVIPMSVLLALTSRLESLEFLTEIDTYIACALTYGCTMSIFFTRNFYKSFTRHVTIDTAITIILASFVSAFVLFNFIIFGALKVPLSVPFIQATFLIVFITSLRFLIRAIGQNINIESHKNIAIYGAGTAGRQLVEA